MKPFLVTVLLMATAAAQERPLPDYATFAASVKKHLATDEERQSSYMFVERRVEQKIDAAGHTTSEAVKVFEVYPGLPGQERYRRLIEENGQRLVPDKLARQDQERQKDVEEYVQSQSSESRRQKAARESEKTRRRYSAAVDDLFRVYDIRLVRREQIDGHDTILATLNPKNDVTAQTSDGKVMQHFKARAWVSESDYELVRVEAEAIRDLSIGLGILGRVHEGTIASYERRKVNDEVWLPRQIDMDGERPDAAGETAAAAWYFGILRLPEVHRRHVNHLLHPINIASLSLQRAEMSRQRLQARHIAHRQEIVDKRQGGANTSACQRFVARRSDQRVQPDQPVRAALEPGDSRVQATRDPRDPIRLR